MATLKQLKRVLKKAGLKTTGSKRALTRRAKHLMRGGNDGPGNPEFDEAELRQRQERRDRMGAEIAQRSAREAAAAAEAAAAEGLADVERGRQVAREAAREGERRLAGQEAQERFAREGRGIPGGFLKRLKKSSKKRAPPKKRTVTKKRAPTPHLTDAAYRY